MQVELVIETESLKGGAGVLRAINNKFRRKIIKLLQEKERLNVSTMYKKLKLEQSVTSQHLRILRNARLVNTERAGKEIYYSLNYERFKKVDRLVKKILK